MRYPVIIEISALAGLEEISQILIQVRFPLKDENRSKLWLVALKRYKFISKKHHYVCSEHFLTEDFLVRPGYEIKKLRPNAIPSVFNFPKHLLHEKKNHKLPKKRIVQEIFQTSTTSNACSLGDNNIHEREHKKQLIESQNEQLLKKKVKCLQQKLRRKSRKINNLSQVIKSFKDKKWICKYAANFLNENFSGLTANMFTNGIKNLKRDPTGKRYSEEVKKFALTI
nr:THAP domain-containing protein 1-like [Hydra vulgaris]